MKILIAAATYAEIAPFLNALAVTGIPDEPIIFDKHELTFVVSGVGMVSMAYALGKAFTKRKYDLAINVGIAGSFSKKIKIGQLVEVREDIFSELGAEDDEEFITLEEMQLGDIFYSGSFRDPSTTDLQKVKGITVNRVHGNEESIENVLEMFTPKVESMEGAAFFYACEEAEIPSLQVRTISNYVEKRDRNNWDIPLAVKNINIWLHGFLKNLN
ncbi:futalosine nucleosidase [Pseudopedobacter saltans DSM 12145]|uniref:Futalosine hydrolase n=1 Tax=Pseudopedobacter saltans (strain ATCC 51119 / DSM 12145 / JCM 21818 / CCUG 39354 / LMG 10337 / NBRC 100064 / NCIMB 13643) TaxID=762903 RepID=F0S8G1_PSESL|nr:futalosine hydrolase [Pseudopedobacter saltans]ADY53425.1 futalosine nucleosidase [Pseudopedobacter saltans DSM 12145]